jgi:hypothetical protein
MLPYNSIPATKMLMACSDFAEAVTSKRIAHNDPFLDSQIASAQRRFIGTDGAWRWTISKSPITGVIGATLGTAIAAKSFYPVQVFL